MAHGYLSYQDLRGKSGIETALEKYLSDRFDDLKERIKKGFGDTNKKIEQVRVSVDAPKALPQGQQGLLRGSNEKQLTGSSPALLAGSKYAEIASARAPKGLLSAEKPIDVEVMGMNPVVGESPIAKLPSSDYAGTRGPIDTSFVNLGVERDLPSANDNFFPKQLSATEGDGAGQIVQSIDRLTMMTTMLVAATKEQTQQQGMIASAQMQQSEKLARQAKASAEEAALEQGGDFSGNTAYAALGGGAARGGGGGPGFGLGGKVLAKNMLGAATKRGAGRAGTRLGAALGGKMMGGFGARMGAKLGSKSVGKVAGGAIAKSLGKKIPLVGLGLGAIFAAQRAMQGDFVGAGLELASGAASTVPGIGTAGSIGIDAALAARDMGVTPFAEGGIITEPTTGLIGEAGKEGVFPLEGSRGKKTFAKFGEGIVEAQLRNKQKVIKLQAEGLAEFYEKKPWWEGLLEGLKKILPSWLGGDGGDDDDDDDGPPDTNRTRDNRRRRRNSTVRPAAGSALTGDYNSFLGGAPALTSGFGMRDTGLAGASKNHKGIDIGVDPGAEVKAIETGKVVDIYKDFGGHGDGVVIQHADGTKNVYGHVQSEVQIGDEVKAGDRIALIKYWPDPRYPAGRQHLHLERIEGGTKVDPQTYLDQLKAADAKDVKADLEKIENNPEIKGLNAMLGDSSKTGEQSVEGVGTMTRTSRTNKRGRTTYTTAYTNEAGERISGAEFKEAVTSAYGDNALRVNQASAEVAAAERASSNAAPQVTVTAPQQQSSASAQPAAPAPAASAGDVLPSALRATQVATAQ